MSARKVKTRAFRNNS